MVNLDKENLRLEKMVPNLPLLMLLVFPPGLASFGTCGSVLAAVQLHKAYIGP
jgi:hypothetical protein